MVDVKEIEKLSPEYSDVNKHRLPETNIREVMISWFVIIIGIIFSRGDPAVILLAIFVGTFIFLALTYVNHLTDVEKRDSQFKELHHIIYQMNMEIEELKKREN